MNSLVDIDGPIDLGRSDWHQITQEQIDAFGRATFDMDPMHVDPEWAKREGPFGGTVAFGFQTMSMLTNFSHQIFGEWAERFPELKYALNYGFDSLRLMSPVPVGRRIRGHFVLNDAQDRKGGGTTLTIRATVEIEGEEKPALVGDWKFVAYPREAAPA